MTSNRTSQQPDDPEAWRTVDPVAESPLFGPQYTDTELAIIERWQMCHTIARNAWNSGLDVDPYRVNRHYAWFKLWYAGGLATGHLMHRTGVRFRKQGTNIGSGG